jgi:tyrosyl-tRNA synthetase
MPPSPRPPRRSLPSRRPSALPSTPLAAPAAAAAAGPPTASVVQILRERGLIQEVTSDELEALARSARLSVYCGFDPTADSLHLGNLLGIIALAWFQRWAGC